MLSSLDDLFNNLSRDQFRETRKYLVILCSTTNQQQANNVTKGREEGKAMHFHEDYRNHPHQPPTLTSDQQQQTEEDLALMTQKGVYAYECMDSF